MTYLKSVFETAWINLAIDCSIRICHQLPNLGHQIPEHVDIAVVLVSIRVRLYIPKMFQVLLEIMQTHLVPILILSIVL